MPRCTSAYQFDFLHRRNSGAQEWKDELCPVPEFVCFRVLAECGDSNCEARIELIAIRDRGTSKETVYAETPWKVEGILCSKGHQIAVPPVPERFA